MSPLPLLGRAVPGTALLVLSAAFVIETFAQSGGTPFTGSPQSLPGILQAEDFNNGGEGVAYHDNSPANQGGQYRSSGVDIAAASDVGGGYTLGWVGAGEWLNYTVNVGASGTYQLEVRVASAGTGGTFHIEVDGVDKTGPLPVPNTGGWQSWATIRAPNVVLDAGIQVWRLAMDTYGASGAVGNINYIRVMAATSGETTPFGGVPAALPGVVQAENFDEGGRGVAYVDTTPGNAGGRYRTTDVDIEATADVGGGYNVGWLKPGEWMKYSVTVAAAGTYAVDIRVAAPVGGARFHLDVDGVDRTGALTIPATGAYQAWTTITASGVSLSAGPQVWAIVIDSSNANGGVGNINYIRARAESAGGSSPFGGIALSLPGTIQAENFDEGGRGVAYADTTSGNTGGAYRTTDVDIEATTDAGGGHNVGWLKPGEWMKYTVNVAAAGTYTIEARVAASLGGARFHLESNGVDKTGPLTFPTTGAYQA
jgi:hypothetical protein